MVDPKAKSISLSANSDKEFFLIHGYTGSPTDFSDLPYLLHKEFKTNVYVPLMPGHGTSAQDLSRFELRDFIEYIEKELVNEIKKGKKIILVGLSLGSQLALYLASKYSVIGVVIVSTTYKMRFPFNFPPIKFLGLIKKEWPKILDKSDLAARPYASYYSTMPSKGLFITNEFNKIIKKRIYNITSPILILHSTYDRLGDYKKLYFLEKAVSSKIVKTKIYGAKSHNLFSSTHLKEVNDEIVKFVEDNELLNRKKDTKISAVIPSFNEGPRIGGVLEVLTQTKLLDEIIIVDDGSKDNTAQIVKKILKKDKRIIYLKNRENMGKSFSMNRGVTESSGDIIFFCDADLQGLKPEYINEIIYPVLEGKFDMSLGIRNNKMQKSFYLFAINTGERAIRKEIWLQLPAFFKNKYRIEAGLNHYVSRYGRGFTAKIFPYYQTLKEKKYGFFRGTILRWKMNFDVGLAYFVCLLSYLRIINLRDKVY